VGLRLEDKWIWDFWFAQVGDTTHVFFLQAPRSLVDPDLRHRNVTFGHAVSTDLTNWTLLPDPLARSAPGSWDDLATWTGSITRADDIWHLLYTGVSTHDSGLVQRIGLATSRDLAHWERFGDGPVIEADPTWYELLDLDAWHGQAWRDPWVIADPAGNGYHALITARLPSGPPDARGVIGHAVSADLRRWEVLPPFPSPGGFGQLEVPQVVEAGASTLLVFCTAGHHLSAARRHGLEREPGTGTYICRVPGLLGPFDVPESTPMGAYIDLYAGKLVRRGEDWFVMGFLDTIEGEFVGELSDPIPFDPTVELPLAASLPAPSGTLSQAAAARLDPRAVPQTQPMGPRRC
jgi:beta-fructofuranosidase